MTPTTTAPHFQIENVGWTGTEPDYRPTCLGCDWSWQPGRDDDPLITRAAAAAFARTVHRICRRPASG